MSSKLTGGFWARHQRSVLENAIPHQLEQLKAQIEGSEPLRGDVAKFLEAAAHSLSIRPDAELESNLDDIVETIDRAQDDDGYLVTSERFRDREKRYTNLRDWHEMYYTGHFVEAAIAYQSATGKDRLLDKMERNLVHLMSVVGREEGKLQGYPGHEELELALCKLYETTGKAEYLDFAKFLVDERGSEPIFFVDEEARRSYPVQGDYFAYQGMSYFQSHLPVREQERAVGHSVRAGYLYSGMADVAHLTGDRDVADACRRLFDNIVQKQMYITGGLGQTHIGEAFSFDYDLPNDTVYAETCAAISLVFFAKRMLRLEHLGTYADAMERALYNGVLSGISLDGTKYFYVNPLEVHPATVRQNPDYQHVDAERQSWFGCACCPPNIARLVASIDEYVYTVVDGTLFVDLYAASEIHVGEITITQETNYPNDGAVRLVVRGGRLPVGLRIPDWCDDYDALVNGSPVESGTENGYLTLGELKDGDEVSLSMKMEPRFVTCHESVRANAGQVALQYGPLVYCAEEVDNGENLHQVVVDPAAPVAAVHEEDLLCGIAKLTARGHRQSLPQDSLYAAWGSRVDEPAEVVFIPYYAWANRGAGEMRVWMRAEEH